MINNILNKLFITVDNVKNYMNLDIEDAKLANHNALIMRNEPKVLFLEQLDLLKRELDIALGNEFRSGVDITIYKLKVDELETKLIEIYTLNGKLASIIIPLLQMYKEIANEVTKSNGGRLIEVMA